MTNFLYRLKHIVVTLRFSILSIFVTLFVIGMLSLIYINYVYSSGTLLFFANKLMSEASSNLNKEFTFEIEKALRDSEMSVQLINHGVVNTTKNQELVDYTLDLAYQFSIVQAAYWGDANGNFVKSEYQDEDRIMSQVLDRAGATPHEELIYRDEHENEIKRETLPLGKYDPRVRPWYLDAVKAKKAVWSDIYTYQPSGLLGITLATPVYSPSGALRGVFGLDIGLDWMSWYIGEQRISPNAVVFIVTQDGKVIAHSKSYKATRDNKPWVIKNINAVDELWLAESFRIYKKTKQQFFNFEFDGDEYLATYKPIQQFAMHGWTIGIVVPKDDFIGDLTKAILLNTLISLIILLIGLYLVSMFITRVVRPIKNLVTETEKIRHFQLEDGPKIKSRIKEVMALSDAVYAMKVGLKSFQRYIPASLVRQLIEAGEHAHIGGAKKPLTILFSDVVDFTKLAEQMDPNLLLDYMCEYFDELSQIIADEKGTIDKYIGDSIMAFWGAPVVVDQPNHRAARAVLHCERRLDQLNKVWSAQHKVPLYTRFGLHLGEAIVGNVGSTERINYTALGDTINIASRLEGVNKIYNTRILVSDVVYEIIKDDFVLRKIDKIAVRGKTVSSEIYELLAEQKSELTFDIDAYRETYELGYAAYVQKNWDVAIKYFEKCLQIYPQDTLAPVFIKRCKNFKTNPPENWDGVWRIGD